MKKIIISLLIISTVFLYGCSENNNSIKIEQPEKIATGDQIYSAKNEKAVEESDNVNGVRFTQTLDDFTESYNKIAEKTDGLETIKKSEWQNKGIVKNDINGVETEYFYYNEKDTNFTATVEKESGKIMNIGCGTTMSNFVWQDENSSNSDKILRKAAVMATAVCGFPVDSLDVFQDIFYRTTFDATNSFWYQGFVFTLSTQENKIDSEKSVMLLRVFPIKDELKEEWKVTEYETIDNYY